jgi:hypothetical protein
MSPGSYVFLSTGSARSMSCVNCRQVGPAVLTQRFTNTALVDGGWKGQGPGAASGATGARLGRLRRRGKGRRSRRDAGGQSIARVPLESAFATLVRGGGVRRCTRPGEGQGVMATAGPTGQMHGERSPSCDAVRLVDHYRHLTDHRYSPPSSCHGEDPGTGGFRYRGAQGQPAPVRSRGDRSRINPSSTHGHRGPFGGRHGRFIRRE